MRGTKKLLAKLDNISNAVKVEVPNKVDEEVQRRTEGAQSGFDSAYYHGHRDVSVESFRRDDEWSIVASGESVLFIEFGTGIIYPHTSPIDHPYNYPGSWSVEHGQFLTDSEKLAQYHGGWPLNNGVISYGNPSANVMYQTGKAIESTLPSEVKQVLDKAVKS